MASLGRQPVVHRSCYEHARPQASRMEKTKCAVIQDDILAVKHALANGIAFEALEGDDLKELLATLQAQRAEVIGAAKRSASSGAGGGASFTPTPPKAAPQRSAPKSSQGDQNARAEAPAAKDKPSGGAAPKRKSATPTKRPAPPARTQHTQAVPPQEEKVVKKPRVTSTAERLRQLRKSIRVRDVVSVLMDIPMTGAWIRSWVRGEVMREVSSNTVLPSDRDPFPFPSTP